jgi:hypothetical protein
MKNYFVSCSLFAFAFCALNVTAQDAEPLQAQGTWYLGSADATSLFRMFSSEGMEVSPFVGYAIADNIAITVGIDYNTMTMDADDEAGTAEQTATSSIFNVGGAYFFGDNFFAQAQLGMGSASVDDGVNEEVELSSSSYGIGLGKFIPIKDMWYVSPALTYGSTSNDDGSQAGASIAITFGARF